MTSETPKPWPVVPPGGKWQPKGGWEPGKRDLAATHIEAMNAKTALARFNLMQAMKAIDRMVRREGDGLKDDMAALGESAMAVSGALTLLGSAMASAEGALAYGPELPEAPVDQEGD
jgi:hypothetical protein